MKIKVESISLKTILTEEAYNVGFKEIKAGDMFIVVTASDTHHGEVLDKYSNQIIVQIKGNKYLITDNSLEGDTLRSYEYKENSEGKLERSQTATITKNIKSIFIRRNGNTVTTLTPDVGRDEEGNGEEREIKQFYKDAYEEVTTVLKKIKVDNKLVIKAGEMLITQDNIRPDSVTTFDIHIRKIEKGKVEAKVVKVYGDNEGKYDFLNDDLIVFNMGECVEVTENGVSFIFNMTKTNKKVFIEGVFEMNIGKFFDIDEPSFDELLQDKDFRDLISKEPKFYQQLLGMKAKGVFPTMDILNKIGLKQKYNTRGNKVEFVYHGKNIREGYDLNLTSGGKYIGVFKTSNSIRLTGTKRGESLLIKMQKTLNDENLGEMYQVIIEFNKILNGKKETEKVGTGLIQIKNNNVK